MRIWRMLAPILAVTRTNHQRFAFKAKQFMFPKPMLAFQEAEWGDYVTRCLCEMQHNDEWMVECEKCK